MSSTPPSLPPELERAFRATGYFAFLPAGARLELRIEVPHATLDARLARLGCREWAFLHAVNPGARRGSEAENARRHRDLLTRLEAMRRSGTLVAWHEGESRADDGSWPHEPATLALGLAREPARQLGAELGQVAIVVGNRGGAPALLACGTCPPSAS